MLRTSVVHLASSVAAVVAVALAPAGAHALDLVSPAGHTFDVQDTSDGSLSDGTRDSYDGMYYLTVDGIRYSAGAASTMSLGGRQVEMGESAAGTLMVRRMFYVPDAAMAPGSSWGRYVDILRNPTATVASVTIQIDGNLGSDSGTVVTATSDGDTLLTIADDWFATDDAADGSGDASLAHVIAGAGGLTRPATAMITRDTPDWTFTTSVPAGGQVAVMTFVIQHDDRAAAHAEAMRVVALPPETLVGIDTLLSDIINFDAGMSTPNEPPTTPTILSPADGARLADTMPMLVAGNATDADGDPLTYFFEIDSAVDFTSPFLIPSGAVAEGPTQTSWVVPTNLMPQQWYWRVKASDGREESPWQNATFVVGDAPFADGGVGGDGGTGADGGGAGTDSGGFIPTGRRRGSGCCHVSGSDPAPKGLPWVVGALVLALLVRRTGRR